MPLDLRNMTPREIDRFCLDALGQRPGQGLRVAALVFRKRVDSIDAMTGLNRTLRSALAARCTLSSLHVERTEAAADGTTKLLYRLRDSNSIEGVMIPGAGRLTLCVSTQVGCASGCGFCLTGSGGYTRNLSVAEMVNQVFAASSHAGGKFPSNIVLMGTGEPLANYDAVRSFIDVLTDRYGMGFASKKVTISTSGLAPMIERLAQDGVEASLAVSLNATTDAVRDRLMPVNRIWPLTRVLEALRTYTEKTGRTVTIEYILLREINDSSEDAKRLVDLTDGLPCMVNLLMFNPYAGCSFQRSEEERLSVFRDILVRAGRIAVVRKSRGREVNAACGQLRAVGR